MPYSKEQIEYFKARLLRDRGLPPRMLVDKLLRYGAGVLTAPWHLRWATKVGSGTRTVGRPRFRNYGTAILGRRVQIISEPVRTEVVVEPGATLEVGDDVLLNYGVSLGVTQHIRIGHHVMVGPHGMIVDSEFHDPYERALRPTSKPVSIDDHAWLGARVCVLPGVHIGTYAVVGAGAVVTKDVPAYAVAAGVPARLVGEIDRERIGRTG